MNFCKAHFVYFPTQDNKDGTMEEEEKQTENGKKEEDRGREQEGEREADKTESEMGTRAHVRYRKYRVLVEGGKNKPLCLFC